MMGYDIKLKGIDIAINAIKKAREKNNKIVLAIVMSSNKEENIKEISKWFNGKFPNWIHILDANQNIGEYYKLADAFISASRAEGFSNALVEAIYSKLPAIISNIKGTSWANNLSSINSYDTLSEDELTLKIESLMKNSVNINELENSKNIVIEQYSINKWCKEVISIYQKILKS